MNALLQKYERALTELFWGAGYKRAKLGIYLRPVDDEIWRGLWVTFHTKSMRTVAQPNVTVFCPRASEITRKGLAQRYPEAGKAIAGKFGNPLITRPLYDCIRDFIGEDRTPFSYDINNFDEVNAATCLIWEDFTKVAETFFGHITTIEALRDDIAARPRSTGAGIDAMALSYLLDKDITDTEIDRLTRISPNIMTKEFAEYFKAYIATRRA